MALKNRYSITNFILCLSILLAWGLHACRNSTKKGLEIISRQVLDSVPSGSGIAIEGNTAYIVGDDATHIFQLYLGTLRTGRLPIRCFDTTLYREPKPVKHDFESATLVTWKDQTYLLAIGSGSLSPARDSAMIFNISNPADCNIYSLADLYRYLQRQAHTDTAHWNIEGATVAGNKLILANRGNNSLLVLHVDSFMDWSQTPSGNFPTAEIQNIKLPAIKNKEAHLSGLSTYNDTQLLFCASVEDTPTWATDGAIYGSFIGTYSIADRAVKSVYLLQGKDGNPLIEKIESLDILYKNSKNRIKIIAIADNDNGTTEVFTLYLPL